MYALPLRYELVAKTNQLAIRLFLLIRYPYISEQTLGCVLRKLPTVKTVSLG